MNVALGSWRNTPGACAGLGRLFRTLPPFPRRREVAAGHVRPPCHLSPFSRAATFRGRGRDKSSPPSSPVSRHGAPGDLRVLVNGVAFNSASLRASSTGRFYCCSCESPTGEMASPTRDPASEQLNEYKKKVKVRRLPSRPRANIRVIDSGAQSPVARDWAPSSRINKMIIADHLPSIFSNVIPHACVSPVNRRNENDLAVSPDNRRSIYSRARVTSFFFYLAKTDVSVE